MNAKIIVYLFSVASKKFVNKVLPFIKQYIFLHLQFRRLHFAIYAAFTFQTCLIWAAATTADPTTGHSGEGGRGNPVSDHGGESSRRAQNQNCLIATTSDLTLSSPSSK